MSLVILFSALMETDYFICAFMMTLFFLLLLTGFLTMLLYISREKYRIIYKINEDFTGKQVEYYKALLSQEEETRRFRHDVRNHIICLKELIQEGKLSDLEEYVNHMSSGFEKIARVFDVGNDIINAILNYYSNQGKESGIEVVVKGRLFNRVNIPSIDLCTVVSNMMSNAFEAATKVKNSEERRIEVYLNSSLRYLELMISNPVHKTGAVVKDGIPTSKEDKRNHGFGIKNIKKIVNKYDGMLEFSEEFNRINVRIRLKIS